MIRIAAVPDKWFKFDELLHKKLNTRPEVELYDSNCLKRMQNVELTGCVCVRIS
jgi:hypothetical protein